MRARLTWWQDTAGQERYAALGPIYYRDANGALLVYDITDRQSFDRVKQWVKELKKMKEGDCVLVIIGNKIDLERTRTVTLKEAEEYAKSVGAQHFSTSAKLNKVFAVLCVCVSVYAWLLTGMQGLEELFIGLTREMMEMFPEGGSAKKNMSLGGAGPQVDYDARPQSEGCSC